MSEYRQKLQALLRELFQFDSADLDFGIYAVMNHKRDQIERFIAHDLLDAIAEGLELQSEAQQAKARADFAQARQELQAEYGEEAFDAHGDLSAELMGASGQTARRLREAYLSAQQALAASELSNDLEGQVCNDLFRFFSRYYDDGDFNTKRRYGGREKYVIPYQGEEVLLHWANRDQYYVKTGEYFSDYRFAVEPAIGFSGATVHCKLRQASIEQNNVKGEKRFFVLAGDDPAQWDPAGRVLTIGFEYRPLAADEKLRAGSRGQQDKLNAEAEAAVLKAIPDALLREQLGKLRGEPGKERSLLARHLTRYSARNTRDYFIHKDLGAFLRRELDFFLKNEVLRLEDLDWGQPALVQATANRIQTLQLIAGRIIDFLAQIEDFQKRLWEKRKFVVQSDWCVTLDRVPAELYGEIAAEERQRAEWQKLYGVALGPDADLGQHPFLMVDTAFFDDDFKARLLASFDDLDAACDGLLVHSENYQALRLLTPRYKGTAGCVHIDPPYNTQTSGFLYKNEYQHSSWLAMMENRIAAGLELMAPDGSFLCHIDENEYERLHFLFDHFGVANAGTVIWDKRNPMNAGRGLATQHEYVTWRSDREAPIYLRNENVLAILEAASEIVTKYQGVTKEAQKEYASWIDAQPAFTGGERAYRYIDEQGQVYQSVSLRAPEPRTDPKFFEPLVHPVTGNPCAVPPNGFSRTPETLQAMVERGEIIFGPDESTQPRQKVPLRQETRRQLSSVIQEARRGKADISPLGLDFPYCHPVVFYERLIGAVSLAPDDVVIDFFAGSGTTAHAVINLNAQDDGSLHYVLVEVGDYFDTILKPRILKVAYAADWRDGKPVPGSPGQSHMFHTIRLESYEDSLNNLRFQPLSDATQAALYALPDYFLRYMLDFETRGSPSLLDTAQFERPFQYQLRITQQQVTSPRPVDLVTTFNFLLGLRVRTVRSFERPLQNSDFSEKSEFFPSSPVVRVLGEDSAGRRVCVLWRDTPSLAEMEAEKQWLQAHVLADVAYDLLYINGESALPDALPIEGEFQRLMFEGMA